jgi:plastocyanin
MGRRRATTAAAAAILWVAGGVVLTVAWPVTTAPVIAQTTAPPGAPSGAGSGIPAEIEPYRSWTKMNAAPLTDPSNPRAGAKNTFVNLTPAQLRDIVGSGGRVQQPFPDGTIVVRETLDPDAGFVRILFVQRKDAAQARTKGWVFSGFARNTATDAYQPLPIADPVVRCLNCHEQVRHSDQVFTPYLNRPDALPARPRPAAADRVEIFNYAFSPRELRVKVGTTVTFANYDAVVHDVKAASAAFESGNIPTQGRHFETFSLAGTLEYFCAVHLEMRGRIVVEP